MVSKKTKRQKQEKRTTVTKPPVKAASLLMPEQTLKNHANGVPTGNKVYYQEVYSGPLPHPTILSGLDSVVPGAARIVIDQFAAQGNHRRELEKSALAIESRNSLLGIIFAGTIVVLSILIGGFLVWSGRTAGGLWLSGASIASVAGAFIYGTNQRRKERVEKAVKNPPPTVPQNHNSKAQVR